MTQANRLTGKVALVTGGTRGIGLAIAQALAAAGAAVWTTSRRAPIPTSAEKVGPGQVGTVALDVTDETSVRMLFHALDEAYGRLDLLVNNAGIGVFRNMEDIQGHEFRSILETNVLGAFLCSQEAYVRMRRQGGGRIVNIGSIAGISPIQGNAAYGASKFALRGLSLTLNEEAKGHNVRVTIVNLGAVYTEIWRDREGFCEADMLRLEDVAATVTDIAARPLHVRIDEVTLVPPKGIL